jgi:crossover junction endodeoxyribonuclease RuvC
MICRGKPVYCWQIILLLEKESKIILGIDPGTLVMGYGLLEIRRGRLVLLELGTLKLSSFKDPYERLRLIQQKVEEIILGFRPQDFAIEAPFFGKNVQSMLKLGRAQGVAIATAMRCGIPVTEYSPKKIKLSITGNGNASKEQVWKMLRTLLPMEDKIARYDASDALAVALCHHFQYGSLGEKNKKSPGGWAGYLKNNPARILTN